MIFQSQNLTLAEFVQYASPEQLAERRDEIWAELDQWQAVKDEIDDRTTTEDFEGYLEYVETFTVKKDDHDDLKSERDSLLDEIEELSEAKRNLEWKLEDLEHAGA